MKNPYKKLLDKEKKKNEICCKNCDMRKTLILNFVDKEHPLIFNIECGLCPDKNYKSNCQYFKKKSFLGIRLYKNKE